MCCEGNCICDPKVRDGIERGRYRGEEGQVNLCQCEPEEEVCRVSFLIMESLYPKTDPLPRYCNTREPHEGQLVHNTINIFFSLSSLLPPSLSLFPPPSLPPPPTFRGMGLCAAVEEPVDAISVTVIVPP